MNRKGSDCLSHSPFCLCQICAISVPKHMGAKGIPLPIPHNANLIRKIEYPRNSGIFPTQFLKKTKNIHGDPGTP
jgi:hypothetical protein